MPRQNSSDPDTAAEPAGLVPDPDAPVVTDPESAPADERAPAEETPEAAPEGSAAPEPEVAAVTVFEVLYGAVGEFQQGTHVSVAQLGPHCDVERLLRIGALRLVEE